MLIFLIGMPGVGKSFWGAKLAAAYQLPFTDLDVFIATQEQATIPAMFGLHGEEVFRVKERHYLQQLMEKSPQDAIIACGGGTPCYGNNMELMKAGGTVICLAADIDHLIANLRNSHEDRPLLRALDIKSTLSKLLMARENIYATAHHIVPVQNITLANFDQIISACIGRH